MLKATGIVRRVDELGRIVIPKELRTTYHIHEMDPLEIYTDGKGIILQKYKTSCLFCGESDAKKLIQYSGETVCRSCARHLASMAKEAPGC